MYTIYFYGSLQKQGDQKIDITDFFLKPSLTDLNNFVDFDYLFNFRRTLIVIVSFLLVAGLGETSKNKCILSGHDREGLSAPPPL